MADELTQPEAGGDTYREEVERALSEDEKRLGKVWRLSQEGLNSNEIAEKLSYSKAYINHSTRMIKALVDSTLPNTTTLMARRYGAALRDFAKRHQGEYLSNTTVAEIEKRTDEWADECVRRANDRKTVKREEEEQKLERQTSAAEKEEVPGIYVYALPHYLRYPVETSENDETDDRTYLKVGMSERDAIKRFRQQRGSTALSICLKIANGISILPPSSPPQATPSAQSGSTSLNPPSFATRPVCRSSTSSTAHFATARPAYTIGTLPTANPSANDTGAAADIGPYGLTTSSFWRATPRSSQPCTRTLRTPATTTAATTTS